MAIPIARYRFSARLREPVRLPDYAGSLLRGQFGAALRNVACMTRQPTCTGCPLTQTCPYTRIFEAPPPAEHALQKFSQIPNAYVIEPPVLDDTRLQAGDILQFNMVLAGEALPHLALITFAWQRALKQGLTKSRSAAELATVDWMPANQVPATVWQAAKPLLLEHTPLLAIPAPPDGLQQITLKFSTPLRLQQQGQPLRADQVTPRTLLAAVARRVALVMEFHAHQTHWGAQVPVVAAMAETLTDERQLHWHDWTRYSSRQQQEMTLGGLVGVWTLKGPPETLAALWPWLWLG
jgi:hypothetical protein